MNKSNFVRLRSWRSLEKQYGTDKNGVIRFISKDRTHMIVLRPERKYHFGRVWAINREIVPGLYEMIGPVDGHHGSEWWEMEGELIDHHLSPEYRPRDAWRWRWALSGAKTGD